MTFTLSKTANPEKIFATRFTQLETRWDPNYYRFMSIFKEQVASCTIPLEKLKHSLALVQYGISERATEEAIGTPMLRMINLQDDTWDLSDMKYIQMTENEKKRFLLRNEDILFNRTNSKELVGKCGIFNLSGEYVFASYLIRVRLKQGTLLPEYVTAFLSSNLGRLQINAVSRQIAGMTNINAEEICGLLLPIPDNATQEKIVVAWKEAVTKRDSNIEKAKTVLATIDDILLDELGIPRQPEPPATLESRIFDSNYESIAGLRWDPLYHQGDIFYFIRKAKYDFQRLGKKVKYFITGFPAGRNDQVNEEDGGIIQIRPTNLSEDRELVFNRNVYIGAAALETRKADLLKHGEVLFNNTNSQDLVGKTVCFDIEGKYFSSNHITRVGVKADELDQHYLYFLLNLYQRRKVFFKLCTNWNNQSGVGSDVLQSIPIPLPDLQRQIEIVRRLESIYFEARSLREKARSDFEQSKRKIEAMILGKEAG